jgi:hypothetical protein
MLTLLVILSLSCPKTVVVNTTKEPWSDYDTEMLEYTKKRCGQVYEDAPCLKWFKKWDHQSYSGICGAKVKD